MGNMTLANDAKTVDDVLASIRKLVSDETKARSIEAKKKSKDAGPAEKLMLTPELKVVNEKPLVLDAPVTDTDATIAKPEAAQEPESVAPFQDEVALRALVSEMIREELQGELGNRITRNVRKLVRREIEQAMKSRTDA